MTIKIEDLSYNTELDVAAMSSIKGGYTPNPQGPFPPRPWPWPRPVPFPGPRPWPFQQWQTKLQLRRR